MDSDAEIDPSPSRGFSTTATDSPPPQSIVDDDEVKLLEQEELAIQVYQDLWRKFYDWDHNSYCKQHLETLSRVLTLHDLPPPPWRDQRNNALHEVYTGPSNTNKEFEFEVHDFEPHHVSFNLKQSHPPIRVPQIDFYPRYTTCTPVSQNLVTHIPNTRDLSFIPAADDPKFPVRTLLEEDCDELLWQTDFKDADVEVIHLETARRLHFAHNFTYPEIDRLPFLSGRLRDTSRSGIIWESQQRDLVSWPELRKDPHNVLPVSHVTSTTLAEHVQEAAPLFCANLNCIQTHCNIHKHWEGKNLLRLRKPKFGVDHMWSDKEMKKDPCKNRCYKVTVRDEIDQDDLLWSASEYEQFMGIIALAPDAKPCELAVLYRRDCREVYKARRQWLLTDTEVEGSVREVWTADDKVKYDRAVSNATKSAEYMLGGCSHVGSCNQYANCACFKTGSKCNKACRCLTTCNIRMKGCKCKSGTNEVPRSLCRGGECPCRMAERECDPELCLGCKSSKAHKSPCGNNIIQQGDFPDLMVKPAKFGLGAFALKNIDEGVVIGGYYGELLRGGYPAWLTPLQHHEGLNYAFNVQPTTKLPGHYPGSAGTIDSWNAGNVTRYLNHPEGDEKGCEAGQRVVNGVEIVYLQTVAPMRAGEELFFYYGEDYWLHSKSLDSQDDKSDLEDI